MRTNSDERSRLIRATTVSFIPKCDGNYTYRTSASARKMSSSSTGTNESSTGSASTAGAGSTAVSMASNESAIDDSIGASGDLGGGEDGAGPDLDDPDAYGTGLKRSDSSSSINFIHMGKLLYLQDFDFGLGLDHVNSTKKRFHDMKHKTTQKFKKLKIDPTSNKDLAKLQELLNQRLSKFDAKVHVNLQSSSTEKLFYALAVFAVATGGFIIGKYPCYFHVFHTVLFCLLMPIRFYSYFKQSFQYYLADLCYYVNLLLMLFIWFKPDSKSLFVSAFSLSLGTLSFAVITWRNSLVLHSIEKTTSSFIHVMPPITLFVLVHELPVEYVKQRFPAIHEVNHWNFINGILTTSVYYTIWQVSYHYFITIRKKNEIQNGKVTSFTFLKKKNRASPLGKFVNSLPYNWMQITAFTLIQFFYQILTMTFCPIWFQYKHLCGAFVAFVFIWASYNGATYYIDVFGKRFEKEVGKLKAEIDGLQAKIAQSQPVSPEMAPSQPVSPELVPQTLSPEMVPRGSGSASAHTSGASHATADQAHASGIQI